MPKGTPKGTPKKDPQRAFEEKELEDPELADLLDKRMEAKEAARLYASTNRKLKDHIANKGLVDDVRYRCSGWVFRLASHTREAHEVDGGTTRRFAELKAEEA